MTTFTIGDHSSSSTEESFLSPLFGGHQDQSLLRGEPSSIDDSFEELLRDLYGDLDTSNSSQLIIANYEDEVKEVGSEPLQTKELNDFKRINKFADKILEDIQEEPVDVQKKTYDKFWDLF